MPLFREFDYFFYLNVVKLDLNLINMQQVYTGWISILIPLFYQKFLIKKNYIVMFTIGQIAYVFADSFNLLLSSRLNLTIGIPDIVLFMLGGSIAERLEKGFFFFPSMIIYSKIFPVGIEATLWSLTSSVQFCSFLLLRPLMGVLINNLFIHVTVENMENYIYIKLVQLISSILPLLFMWYFIPSL